jgi:hypothetical protein
MAGAGTASGAVKAAGILEVAAVIVTDPVLEQIRRELRRRTGHDMDPAELSELITSGVLRPDAPGPGPLGHRRLRDTGGADGGPGRVRSPGRVTTFTGKGHPTGIFPIYARFWR